MEIFFPYIYTVHEKNKWFEGGDFCIKYYVGLYLTIMITMPVFHILQLCVQGCIKYFLSNASKMIHQAAHKWPTLFVGIIRIKENIMRSKFKFTRVEVEPSIKFVTCRTCDLNKK